MSVEQHAVHAADLVKARVDVILAGGVCGSSRCTAGDDECPNFGFDRRYGWPRFCALARPAGPGIPQAPPFSSLNLTASGKSCIGSRRCLGFAGLRRLQIGTPPRHHGCERLEEAAHARGVELSIHQVGRGEEIGERPSTRQRRLALEPLNVLASSLLFNSRAFIFGPCYGTASARRCTSGRKWPSKVASSDTGPLIVQLYRDIMSRQLVQLLRGVSPRYLPVEQPTRFELVINVRTAKAIGHEVPAPLVRTGRQSHRIKMLIAAAHRSGLALSDQSRRARVGLLLGGGSTGRRNTCLEQKR